MRRTRPSTTSRSVLLTALTPHWDLPATWARPSSQPHLQRLSERKHYAQAQQYLNKAPTVLSFGVKYRR